MKKEAQLLQLNRWFEQFFSFDSPDYAEKKTFAPPYEIAETSGHYLMSLDLPGTSAREIRVEIVGDELVITGERRPRAGLSDNSLQGKRRYGKFRRAFTLPRTIDEERIEANYQNGVLEIAIPKREQPKSRGIVVEEGRDLSSRVLAASAALPGPVLALEGHT